MLRLSEDEFAELVDEALEGVPPQFKRYMENLAVEIRQRPTPELLKRLKVRGGRDLLGVYHGTALPDKSVEAPFEYPETIFIFQRNIEAVCDTRRDVVEQVRVTVLHEIGHHFGMDEDDLEELGYD
ncbi:MAG: metallopeptidase family protein [Phycisphaerae bacterium]